MFDVGGPRCLVMLLEMMLSKCLSYQEPYTSHPYRNRNWMYARHSKQSVGVHTVNGFMKVTGGLKGIGKQFTNQH